MVHQPPAGGLAPEEDLAPGRWWSLSRSGPAANAVGRARVGPSNLHDDVGHLEVFEMSQALEVSEDALVARLLLGILLPWRVVPLDCPPEGWPVCSDALLDLADLTQDGLAIVVPSIVLHRPGEAEDGQDAGGGERELVVLGLPR